MTINLVALPESFLTHLSFPDSGALDNAALVTNEIWEGAAGPVPLGHPPATAAMQEVSL
jgi:hypothetical protein